MYLLLASCDITSIHLALNSSTYALISSEKIQKIKEGCRDRQQCKRPDHLRGCHGLGSQLGQNSSCRHIGHEKMEIDEVSDMVKGGTS
jgi:hypothetical protein